MTFLNDYPQLKYIQDIAHKEKVSIYLVGGFLRDFVLHNQKNDFDFAVERNALKVARSFSRKIKGAYILLDKDRGCARVAKKQNGKLYTFDFADYRAKTFKGDLGHRDFTINTLSLDLASVNASTEMADAILDHKSGLKDIKAKRIRRTSVKVFKEDPLRMLRAFSLQATLGFEIEKETLKQIKKEKDLIRGVSAERIRDELFKILESGRTAATLKTMDKNRVARQNYSATEGYVWLSSRRIPPSGCLEAFP